MNQTRNQPPRLALRNRHVSAYSAVTSVLRVPRLPPMTANPINAKRSKVNVPATPLITPPSTFSRSPMTFSSRPTKPLTATAQPLIAAAKALIAHPGTVSIGTNREPSAATKGQNPHFESAELAQTGKQTVNFSQISICPFHPGWGRNPKYGSRDSGEK